MSEIPVITIDAKLAAVSKAAQMLIDADVFEVRADSKVHIEHFGGDRYIVNIDAAFLANKAHVDRLIATFGDREAVTE